MDLAIGILNSTAELDEWRTDDNERFAYETRLSSRDIMIQAQLYVDIAGMFIYGSSTPLFKHTFYEIDTDVYAVCLHPFHNIAPIPVKMAYTVHNNGRIFKHAYDKSNHNPKPGKTSLRGRTCHNYFVDWTLHEKLAWNTFWNGVIEKSRPGRCKNRGGMATFINNIDASELVYKHVLHALTSLVLFEFSRVPVDYGKRLMLARTRIRLILTPGALSVGSCAFIDMVDDSSKKFQVFFNLAIQSFVMNSVCAIGDTHAQLFLFGRRTTVSQEYFEYLTPTLNSQIWNKFAIDVIDRLVGEDDSLLNWINAVFDTKCDLTNYWFDETNSVKLRRVLKHSKTSLLCFFADFSNINKARKKLGNAKFIGPHQLEIFDKLLDTGVRNLNDRLTFESNIPQMGDINAFVEMYEAQTSITNEIILEWLKGIFQVNNGYKALSRLIEDRPLFNVPWENFFAACSVTTSLLFTLNKFRNECNIRTIKLPLRYAEAQLTGLRGGLSGDVCGQNECDVPEEISHLYVCTVCLCVYSCFVAHEDESLRKKSSFNVNADTKALNSKFHACAVTTRGRTTHRTSVHSGKSSCFAGKQRSRSIRCDAQPLTAIPLIGSIVVINNDSYTLCCQPRCGNIMNNIDHARTNEYGYMCRVCSIKYADNTRNDLVYRGTIQKAWKNTQTWQSKPKMHLFTSIEVPKVGQTMPTIRPLEDNFQARVDAYYRSAFQFETCSEFDFIHSNDIERIDSHFRRYFLSSSSTCFVCHPPKIDRENEQMDWKEYKTWRDTKKVPMWIEESKANKEILRRKHCLDDFQIIAPGCVLCRAHAIQPEFIVPPTITPGLNIVHNLYECFQSAEQSVLAHREWKKTHRKRKRKTQKKTHHPKVKKFRARKKWNITSNLSLPSMELAPVEYGF
jgi:hypothetical protein